MIEMKVYQFVFTLLLLFSPTFSFKAENEVPCTNDEDCKDIETRMEEKAKCVEKGNGKVCVCPYSNWLIGDYSDEKFECYSLGSLCNGTNTQCDTRENCNKKGKCVCKSQYEQADGGRRCRIPLDDDLECDYDLDCGEIETGTSEAATCDGGDVKQCKCPLKGWDIKKISDNDYQCYARIGAECTTDADCEALNHAKCSENQCECLLPGFFVPNDAFECVLKAVLHDKKWNCNKDENCAFIQDDDSVATCNMNKKECRCQEDDWFIYGLKDPVCARKIGAECSKDTECRVAIGNSTCDSSGHVCQCLEGFRESVNKTTCVESSASAAFISTLLISIGLVLTQLI